MIKILFFARYREELGLDELDFTLTPEITTLAALHQALLTQGEAWQVLADDGIMCAINQELVSLDSQLQDGDEVAFFPTVTGG